MGSADLHEEARDQSFANTNVIISAGEISAGTLQIEAVHDASELLAHVVCTLQGAVIAEVVIAPLRVLMIWSD